MKTWNLLTPAGRIVGAGLLLGALIATSASGATVAHWNFETDLIAGSAVAGQVVSHPSINGAHDNALEDISGNGNHLSAFAQNGAFTAMLFSNTVLPSNATGSTLSIENRPGECCPALSSQGDLEVGGVKVGALAQWTVEASINLKTLGAWQTIIGKDGGPENADQAAPLYFQKTGDGNQKFRINFRDVAGNRWIADSTTSAIAGEWFNLAATSDGTSLKMYVNGTLEATTPIVSADAAMVPLDETGYAGGTGVTDAPNGWSFMRGMYNDGHGDRVDGYLDDVRISNTALVPNQFLNTFIPSLTLVVNTVSGNVALRNDAAAALPLDYYEVTSAGGALRFADGQWNSLNDQNLDGLGAGNGQSWDEAGGVSANILSEAFLLGQSSLNPGQSISLGAAFNTATFGSGIDGDLAFKFSPKGGALKASRVQYITAAGTPGDYNNDGKVNAADYTVWRDANGTSTTLPNDSTPGTVTAADYTVWVTNFGAGGLATVASAAVPEPTALVCLGLLSVGIFAYRRKA